MTTGSEPRPWRGPLYLDASALVKLYFAEPESAALEASLLGRHDLIASDVAITEITSALARRARDGALLLKVAREAHDLLLDDVASELYERVRLQPAIHRRAEEILLSTEIPTLRAADALHLAMALAAGAASIVSFDRRMLLAARVVQLGGVPELAE